MLLFFLPSSLVLMHFLRVRMQCGSSSFFGLFSSASYALNVCTECIANILIVILPSIVYPSYRFKLGIPAFRIRTFGSGR